MCFPTGALTAPAVPGVPPSDGAAGLSRALAVRSRGWPTGTGLYSSAGTATQQVSVGAGENKDSFLRVNAGGGEEARSSWKHVSDLLAFLRHKEQTKNLLRRDLWKS